MAQKAEAATPGRGGDSPAQRRAAQRRWRHESEGRPSLFFTGHPSRERTCRSRAASSPHREEPPCPVTLEPRGRAAPRPLVRPPPGPGGRPATTEGGPSSRPGGLLGRRRVTETNMTLLSCTAAGGRPPLAAESSPRESRFGAGDDERYPFFEPRREWTNTTSCERDVCLIDVPPPPPVREHASEWAGFALHAGANGDINGAPTCRSRGRRLQTNLHFRPDRRRSPGTRPTRRANANEHL